jgi:hypothetical protein
MYYRHLYHGRQLGVARLSQINQRGSYQKLGISKVIR